jgi:hypothetical protein
MCAELEYVLSQFQLLLTWYVRSYLNKCYVMMGNTNNSAIFARAQLTKWLQYQY